MNLLATALVSLAAGSVPATAIYLWATRGKRKVDAAATLTGSALEFVQAMREEMDETNRELRALRRHVSTLETQMRRRGIPVPEFVWPPQAA